MTPELHGLLFEYGQAFGQPAARCVVDLLEELKPQLKRSVELALLARQGRLKEAGDMLKGLSEDLIKKAIETNQQMSLPGLGDE